MIGELQVAHNNVGGGDEHREKPSNTGVLGADFSVENNRYRIKTIYRADRWNPFMKAPLGVAGLGVKEGDYILSINGRNVTANENLYAFLENTANKQITLSVGNDPTGKGAKNIVVQPMANDQRCVNGTGWRKNRQIVQEKTGGRVAYVYLPDTAGDGYKHFNRMFFAQVDKEAVIVDDRRSSGGQANYVTDVLSRKYLSGWKDRDGMTFETPGGAIYGPKAMLIDQDAGSGGDFLPYAFKRHGLGPLIGKRTWGGLIGIAANPSLIDGGGLTVPFFRFFTGARVAHRERGRVTGHRRRTDRSPTTRARYATGSRDCQRNGPTQNRQPIERKVPPAPAKLRAVKVNTGEMFWPISAGSPRQCLSLEVEWCAVRNAHHSTHCIGAITLDATTCRTASFHFPRRRRARIPALRPALSDTPFALSPPRSPPRLRARNAQHR